MSAYFSYYEFIKSSTATKLGIDNTPTDEQIQDNILYLMHIMDKIREKWTEYCKENCLLHPQIIVNSGYRSDALNKAIKGSKTSVHKIGAACDFEAKNGHNKELFDIMLKVLNEYDIPYDQAIDEGNYSWIHLGLKNNNGDRRKMILHR